MVSIAGRSKLLPIVGYSSTLIGWLYKILYNLIYFNFLLGSTLNSNNIWKLDPVTAKFQLRGLLPYNKEILEPQVGLLKYILEQPYSRDMVCSILGLSNKQKQRCPILEEQLVDLIVTAMEKSENESESTNDSEQSCPTTFFWQHLSSHVIYFVLFHHASFPHMIHNLYEKLAKKNLKKGREHLMWVLLQFLSGGNNIKI